MFVVSSLPFSDAGSARNRSLGFHELDKGSAPQVTFPVFSLFYPCLLYSLIPISPPTSDMSDPSFYLSLVYTFPLSALVSFLQFSLRCGSSYPHYAFLTSLPLFFNSFILLLPPITSSFPFHFHPSSHPSFHSPFSFLHLILLSIPLFLPSSNPLHSPFPSFLSFFHPFPLFLPSPAPPPLYHPSFPCPSPSLSSFLPIPSSLLLPPPPPSVMLMSSQHTPRRLANKLEALSGSGSEC